MNDLRTFFEHRQLPSVNEQQPTSKVSETPPVIPLPAALSHHATPQTSKEAGPASQSSPANGSLIPQSSSAFDVSRLPRPSCRRQRLIRKSRYMLFRRPLLNAVLGKDLARKVKPALRTMARPETVSRNRVDGTKTTRGAEPESPSRWYDTGAARRQQKERRLTERIGQGEEESEAEGSAQERKNRSQQGMEQQAERRTKTLEEREAEEKLMLEETRREAEKWLASWGKRDSGVGQNDSRAVEKLG
ncbi:MAG: hypothetical protein Q9227_002500 [Pyrenula ochraceoflavens]